MPIVGTTLYHTGNQPGSEESAATQRAFGKLFTEVFVGYYPYDSSYVKKLSLWACRKRAWAAQWMRGPGGGEALGPADGAMLMTSGGAYVYLRGYGTYTLNDLTKNLKATPAKVAEIGARIPICASKLGTRAIHVDNFDLSPRARAGAFLTATPVVDDAAWNNQLRLADDALSQTGVDCTLNIGASAVTAANMALIKNWEGRLLIEHVESPVAASGNTFRNWLAALRTAPQRLHLITTIPISQMTAANARRAWAVAAALAGTREVYLSFEPGEGTPRPSSWQAVVKYAQETMPALAARATALGKFLGTTFSTGKITAAFEATDVVFDTTKAPVGVTGF